MSEEQMRVFVVLNSPIDPQVDEETSLEGIFRNIDDAKKHILSEIALCIKNGRNLEYTLDDEVDLNGPAGLIGSVATYEVSEDGEPKYNYWISQKIVQ